MYLRWSVILLYIHKSKGLLGRIPWDTALEKTRVQENWLIFKDDLSELKNGLSLQIRNQAKPAAGDLHE